MAYYKFEEYQKDEELTVFLSGAFHESVSNGVYDISGYRIGDQGKVSAKAVKAAMERWIGDPVVKQECDKSIGRHLNAATSRTSLE